MIKIGDLVEWDLGRKKWLAIVVSETIDDWGTPTALVQWVTGRYASQTDYIHAEDLEVIA